jgi:hypothetical protein
VTVEAKADSRRVAREVVAVSSACTFKTTLTSSRTGSLSVTAVFGGNERVSRVRARSVEVRAG